MPPARRFPLSFIQARWSGATPLAQLFWKDMIVHGTTINILAALLGLVLFALDAQTALGATVYFAPVPYNLFLFAALWRTAARSREPWAQAAQIAGFVWFLVMLVL